MVSAQTSADMQSVLSTERVIARPRKSWWLRLLPVILWQVIALLFCESVLYTAGIGEEEIFKFDKQLGFRHFPDKIVTWRSEGYARSYFDSDGMREPGLTIAKPANTLRVALLGDSLVESLQVPVEQSYGQLIEKTIGAVDGKNVQVVNFGNSGYSTTQDCLLLEEKVFKYRPDLVILGYSSRDMMENWAPPDETVSNVRPAALKLPGHDLIIDSSPVAKWLTSPRARFLQSIEWFRHHSRVWGIISATELQLSMKDPLAKAILSFLTDPVRSSRTGLRSFNGMIKGVLHPAKKVVSGLATVVDAMVQPSNGAATRAATPAATPAATATTTSTPTTTAQPAATAIPPGSKFITHLDLPGTPVPAVADVPVVLPDPAERSQYTRLIAATMGGLIDRMNKDCKSHGVKFLVAGMPCRQDLSPFDGYQVVPELTFEDELTILRKQCALGAVPFIDVNSPARVLPAKDRKSLFISAHLSSLGHVYSSSQLTPEIRKLLTDAK